MEFITPIKPVETVNKIALIDADFIKYFAVSDLIKANMLYDNERNKHLIEFTKERVNNVLNSFNCDGYIFCFSGVSSQTFRNSISFTKQYKGNRKAVESKYENEPSDRNNVMRYIMANYPSLIFNDLEADDVVSMLQTEDTFIYSRDKDLKQVPGTHFDIKQGLFYEISEERGYGFFFHQMLTGDSIDNIEGLLKCGPKKANMFLEDQSVNQRAFNVIGQYVSESNLMDGLDKFCEMWMLLRMRTSRGEYLKKKYAKAFQLVELLKKNKL